MKAGTLDTETCSNDTSNTSARLVKSNILHIDGSDLRLCCLLELHPEPFRVQLSQRMTTLKALTHTDHNNDLFSQYLREIIFRLFLVAQTSINGKIPITQTIWYQVQDAFAFQIENMYNQFEDVTHALLVISLREIDAAVTPLPPYLGLDTVFTVLEEYHTKLFENYIKWCDYLKLKAFPWVEDLRKLSWNNHNTIEKGTSAEICQMVTEIALFKMIWGEAANLRHTPELLNFLFHWAISAFWDSGRRKPIDGTFLQIVNTIVQRMRDEAWYVDNPLKPPDHDRRLYYDDFNEFFWEHDATIWLSKLSKNSDSKMSAQAAGDLITYLARSKYPGNSVKTFSEKRSYAQVLRTFWRIFHWHYFLLHLLFCLRNYWDEEPKAKIYKAWGLALVSAIFLSVLKPLLELSLFDLKSLKKLTTWRDILRTNVLNIIRLGFLGLAIFILLTDKDGIASPHFRWDGIVGFSYLIFYAVHGLFPFLHARMFHSMPFFAFVWSIPGLRWLLGPTKFIAGTAFLAENISNIFRYAIFWIVPIVAKCAFWFFGIMPACLTSVKLLDTIETRPIYFSDFALLSDQGNTMLKILFWFPFYVLWFFDGQIFFLLYGACIATFLGYLRRVGYIQDIKTIQQRLFPLVPAGALFAANVSTTVKEGDTRQDMPTESKIDKDSEADVNVADTNALIDRLKHNYNRQTSQTPLGLRTPRSGRMAVVTPPSSTGRCRQFKVVYANESDPYNKIAQGMNAIGLAEGHNVKISGPIDEATRLRKCFGFVWNEIVNSWRLEDIISNEELLKLQFNELPILSTHSKPPVIHKSCSTLGLNRWSDLRTQKISPLWNRSIARLPVYVYSDLILAFLEACENYQLQLNDPSTRFKTKKSISRRFFEKHLSPELGDQLSSNFRSSLPLEGLREVVEAFFIYLSRYFEHGAIFVEAAENVWRWLRDKPSRLIFFNLLGLRDLHQALQSLFMEAQATRDFLSLEAKRQPIQELHQKVRQCLEKLIDTNQSNDNPLELQAFLTALDKCFTSTLTLTPWCEPPPLSPAEVNSLSLKIQQCNLATASPITGTLGLFGAGEIFAPFVRGASNSNCHSFSTLSRDKIVDIRGLYRLESGAYLPRDIDGVLRLYFRRATRILSVTEARLRSTEAQRRFKFFVNSLLMRIPNPPEVLHMVSMCTLTPYYREGCQADVQGLLEATTDGGIAAEELLRSLMPEEFEHFLERVDRSKSMFRYHQQAATRVQQHRISHSEALINMNGALSAENRLFHYIQFCKHLQLWASNRSQVLTRTVKGIMYYETALQILNYIESRDFSQLHLCRDINRLSFEQQSRLFSPEAALWRNILQLPPPYLFAPSVKSLSRLKFHYVVAAQDFGKDIYLIERSDLTRPTPEVKAALARRNGILELLRTYSSMRIASLENEVDANGRPTGKKFSVLYRWVPRLHSSVHRHPIPASTVQNYIKDKITTSSPVAAFTVNNNNNNNVTGVAPPTTTRVPPFNPFPATEVQNDNKQPLLQTPVRTSDGEGSSVHGDDTASSSDVDSVSKSSTSSGGTPQTDTIITNGSQNASRRHWFNTETKQTASPPRACCTPMSSNDSYNQMHYDRQNSLHFQKSAIIRRTQSTPPTPGTLEACASPLSAVTKPEIETMNASLHFRYLRHPYSLSPEFYPDTLALHRHSLTLKQQSNMRATRSSYSPAPWTKWKWDNSEPFFNTPIVGRDNDLLAESIKSSYREMRTEIIHAAPFASQDYRQSQTGSLSSYLLLDGELQLIYKIQLPNIKGEDGRFWERNPIIGHGKPENQNHAIIFTRGETIQAIDMNMDGYLEENIKLRNLLQEFTAHPRMRILGFREHIFSHNVSSISSYMALQELVFVTNNQRLYHIPLCTRMHYGHPDIFDRFYVQCCGSMSKASNGIHISEDVFAGYNATQRGFTVHHVDYHQVGKGRDVGLQQIFMFEKKVAGGNAEQMLSRDMRRLFDGMDFFRMMSFFFSGPGLFVNSLVALLALFSLLYCKVFLSFTRCMSPIPVGNYWDQIIAPATVVQLQLGMLLIIPIILLIALEKGLADSARQLFYMIIHFATFYYNFMIGTKASVIDSVLLYGGAKYQETGRGFQISHVGLVTLWQFYSFTHFIPAIEILLLLCIYGAYAELSFYVYVLDTWPLWLFYLSFTWTPFLFNPLGIYFPKTAQDLVEFNRWMMAEDLKSKETSWRAWWRTEADACAGLWWHNKLFVLIRQVRFIFLALGLVSIMAQNNNVSDIDMLIYLIASFIFVGSIIVFMYEFKLVNPKLNKFLGFLLVALIVGVMSWLLATGKLSISTAIESVVAFSLLVYGLVQMTITLATRWGIRHRFVDSVVRTSHLLVAYVVFCPILLLASFTASFHEIQTRVLFNPRFVKIVETGLIQQGAAAKKG